MEVILKGELSKIEYDLDSFGKRTLKIMMKYSFDNGDVIFKIHEFETSKLSEELSHSLTNLLTESIAQIESYTKKGS